MYKTMNFEGILEHPLQPNLVIYGRKRLIQNPKLQQLKENEGPSIKAVPAFNLEQPGNSLLNNNMSYKSVTNSIRHTRVNFRRRDTKTAIQVNRIRLGSTEELFQKFGSK
mmetsp:Transcript_26225/g.26126  ORF Transcript_26225/g.26126 Transcript_26225/m.26126 type:complete len:110 (-) Transcript_26225:854-1183(-)